MRQEKCNDRPSPSNPCRFAGSPEERVFIYLPVRTADPPRERWHRAAMTERVFFQNIFSFL